MTWTPPSLTSADKLPTVELAGDDLVETYRAWMREHPEIPRCVPPLYRDFTVRYTCRFGDRVHSYTDIVHYSDELTVLALCHVIDGKKVLCCESFYAEYRGDQIPIHFTAPESTRYPVDWLENEAGATVMAVLAVQAYLLYHRPDIIPVFVDKPRKSSGKSNQSKRERTVRDTVRRYIRLTADDPEPRAVNYRAIQWTVRGHYRRITAKDGTAKLVYVRPHTAKRGEKKITAAKIIMKG